MEITKSALRNTPYSWSPASFTEYLLYNTAIDAYLPLSLNLTHQRFLCIACLPNTPSSLQRSETRPDRLFICKTRSYTTFFTAPQPVTTSQKQPSIKPPTTPTLPKTLLPNPNGSKLHHARRHAHHHHYLARRNVPLHCSPRLHSRHSRDDDSQQARHLPPTSAFDLRRERIGTESHAVGVWNNGRSGGASDDEVCCKAARPNGKKVLRHV